jgi:hypothetical protein
MTALIKPRVRRSPRVPGAVPSLDAHRIERALQSRRRYRYVQPRVEREGLGWKVLSPNCSRTIDPLGGEVAIAWLVPHSAGGWLLFARDHRLDCWQLRHEGPTLATVLDVLCSDPRREFWQ